MKAAELRALSEEELLDKLKELNTQLDEFYKMPKERIEKPRRKGQLRRIRARILTLLNERKS